MGRSSTDRKTRLRPAPAVRAGPVRRAGSARNGHRGGIRPRAVAVYGVDTARRPTMPGRVRRSLRAESASCLRVLRDR
jgi:hypothetical protein